MVYDWQNEVNSSMDTNERQRARWPKRVIQMLSRDQHPFRLGQHKSSSQQHATLSIPTSSTTIGKPKLTDNLNRCDMVSFFHFLSAFRPEACDAKRES